MTCMDSSIHVLDKLEMYAAGLLLNVPRQERQVCAVSGGMSRLATCRLMSSPRLELLIRTCMLSSYQ